MPPRPPCSPLPRSARWGSKFPPRDPRKLSDRSSTWIATTPANIPLLEAVVPRLSRVHPVKAATSCTVSETVV
eukprot:7365253-Pyramimonas_sp.AAC.1